MKTCMPVLNIFLSNFRELYKTNPKLRNMPKKIANKILSKYFYMTNVMHWWASIYHICAFLFVMSFFFSFSYRFKNKNGGGVFIYKLKIVLIDVPDRKNCVAKNQSKNSTWWWLAPLHLDHFRADNNNKQFSWANVEINSETTAANYCNEPAIC